MKRHADTETGKSDALLRISEDRVYADVKRLLTFVSILLLGIFVSSALFPEDPIGLALKLIFFAFLVLSLKNWMAAMLLVLVQIPLFLVPESRRNPMLATDEIVVAFQLLMMLALISRMHSPVGQPFTIVQTLRLLLGHTSEHRLGREQGLQTAARAGREFALATLILAGGLLAITLLVTCILQLVPTNSEFQYQIRQWALIRGWGFRLILLGGLFFFCVLFSWLFIAEVNFRRLSPGEASMYLRSQLVKWLHRDFRLVGRKSRRRKRKGS